MDFVQEADGLFSTTLYSREETISIINWIKGVESSWRPARVNRGSQIEGKIMPRYRSAALLTSCGEPPPEFSEFSNIMNTKIKPFVSPLAHTKLTHHDGTAVIRYQAGDHFTSHRDSCEGNEHRYFSVVCYLNDDFEGGATTFSELNYLMTPQCGKAIIFPSDYLHCAESVISGEKYVLVSWLSGRKLIPWL